MSGTFGDMGNLLKQAQQMQRELDRAREELRSATVEGTSGGGAVHVEVTGEGQVNRITIRKDAVPGVAASDVSMLEDLVLAAVRDGITKANALREERMARVTGGLNLPGIF
jgi:DNA-binding YbaB/EbfC family protein